MKITEAYEAVKGLTDDFFSVFYEMLRFSDGSEEIECVIYIKEFGHHRAPTFALALEKVKASMGKIIPANLDDGGDNGIRNT